MRNKLLLAAVLLTPLAIFTGAKDNFLIKETLAIILMLGAAALIRKFSFDALKTALAFFLGVELLSAINAKFVTLTFSTFILHFCFATALVVASGLTDRQKNGLLTVVMAAGYLAGIYGILQAAGIDYFKWVITYGGRIHSILGNPNFYGGWLAMLIPVTIERSFNTRKFYWIILAALLTVNMYLTGTRGAWVAFIVSIVYLFFSLKLYRAKLAVWAAAAVMVIILFVAGGSVKNYVSSKFSPQEQSVKERVFKWRTAFEMVKKNPVFGVGAGNMKVNFALYQAAVRKNAGYRVAGTSESNVHNEYFQIWAETGTLGLIAFLSIFAVYFLVFAKHPENAGYAAAVAGFLVFSLSNFPLRITPTALYLFTFIGLSYKPVPDLKVSKFWDCSRWLKLGAVPIFCFICYKFAIIPFIADVYRNKGDEFLASGNYARAADYYEKSIRMDYTHSEKSAYDLGEIYRKSNRFDDALRAYEISVDIRNYGEIYNNIANCWWLKKDPEKALANWEIAESLGLPTDADQKTVEGNIDYAKKLLGGKK